MTCKFCDTPARYYGDICPECLPIFEAGEDYALVYRINMEYSGKPDQEGSVFMFISEKEKDRLKYIFDEI